MPGGTVFLRCPGLSCHRTSGASCPGICGEMPDYSFIHLFFSWSYNSMVYYHIAFRENLLLYSVPCGHSSRHLQQGQETYKTTQQALQLSPRIQDAILYSWSLYFLYHSRSGGDTFLDRALEHHEKHQRRHSSLCRKNGMDKNRSGCNIGYHSRSGISHIASDCCFAHRTGLLHRHMSGWNGFGLS